MTKIKIYPIDTNISGSDKWIGTDSETSNRTKNFTVSALADYFNNTSQINLSNSLKFKYDTVEVGDPRASGSFSFSSEIGPTVNFSEISNLLLHQSTSNGKYVVELMNALTGNIVMISKVDDPNKFAFYKITSYIQNETETQFYNTVLSYIQGNGAIEEDEYYFVSLIQFDSESDKEHIHPQGTASAVWKIKHNLNKFPSVTSVNINNIEIKGEIEYIDENNLTITFSAGYSGKAYLN